jgi:steroid delta-isomerase-like uncharacterized protein
MNPGSPSWSAPTNKTETNKAVVRKTISDAWNRGMLDNVDSLIDADYTIHHYLFGEAHGRDAFKGWITNVRTLIPDAHVTSEHLLAEGDQVVNHWTSLGTNTRIAADPLSPMKNQYRGSGLTLFTLRDGRVLEEWYSADSLEEVKVVNPEMAPPVPEIPYTSEEKTNLQLAIRMNDEFWNARHLGLFDDLAAQTFVNYDPVLPAVRFREEFKTWAAEVWAAFPDFQAVVEDVAAKGDRVIMRCTAHGTHLGDLTGFPPPTGKVITWATTLIYRFTEGKIQDLWWNRDDLSPQRQLGVIPTPERPLAPESDPEVSKAAVRRLQAFLNGHDLDAIQEVFAATIAIHATSAQPRALDYYGHAGARVYYGALFAALPDFSIETRDLVAEGALVAARWAARGTFTGKLMGVPGNGAVIDLRGIDLWRVVNGQIAESWSTRDSVSMMQQMGIIPKTP